MAAVFAGQNGDITIPGSFMNRFCFCGKPFGRGKGDEVQGVWVDRIQACTSTP